MEHARESCLLLKALILDIGVEVEEFVERVG